MKCPQCGNKMVSDYPEGFYNCDYCGDRFFLEEDGTLENVLFRGSGTSRECVNCGYSLNGGQYVAPYENGSNEEGYVLCPNCNCPNY